MPANRFDPDAVAMQFLNGAKVNSQKAMALAETDDERLLVKCQTDLHAMCAEALKAHIIAYNDDVPIDIAAEALGRSIGNIMARFVMNAKEGETLMLLTMEDTFLAMLGRRESKAGHVQRREKAFPTPQGSA